MSAPASVVPPVEPPSVPSPMVEDAPAPVRPPAWGSTGASPEPEPMGSYQELLMFGSQIWAIVRKDLALEARRWELLGAMGLFTLLVLVIFTFALDLAAEHAAVVAPGALWVAYVFAGTLGLGRGFAREREWGTLDGLLLAPVDRSAIYLAKLIGNALFMLALEVGSLPVAVVFFNLPVLRVSLIPVLLLGTIGFVSVGTLFAAMAARTRARDILLPVLVLPVSVPVVIAGVKATAGVIDGSGAGPWLGLLAAFDALFVVVGMITADAVLEE